MEEFTATVWGGFVRLLLWFAAGLTVGTLAVWLTVGTLAVWLWGALRAAAIAEQEEQAEEESLLPEIF